MTEEERHYITELNAVLDQYRFSDRVMVITLECLALFVAFAVGMLVGMIWLLIIAAVAVLIFERFGISFKNAPVSKEKLAYRACVIMEALINIKQGTYTSWGGVRVIGVGSGRHTDLYNKFIVLYPALASPKLKRLARIYIKQVP